MKKLKYIFSAIFVTYFSVINLSYSAIFDWDNGGTNNEFTTGGNWDIAGSPSSNADTWTIDGATAPDPGAMGNPNGSYTVNYGGIDTDDDGTIDNVAGVTTTGTGTIKGSGTDDDQPTHPTFADDKVGRLDVVSGTLIIDGDLNFADVGSATQDAGSVEVYGTGTLHINGNINRFNSAGLKADLDIENDNFTIDGNVHVRRWQNDADYTTVNDQNIQIDQFFRIGMADAGTSVYDNSAIYTIDSGVGSFVVGDNTGATDKSTNTNFEDGTTQIGHSSHTTQDGNLYTLNVNTGAEEVHLAVVNIGNGDNTNGVLNIQNGSNINTENINVASGDNSTGIMNVSGGTGVTTGNITVANGNDTVGTVNITGGDNFKACNVSVGNQTGAIGVVNITGGTNVQFDTTNIGSNVGGTGTLNVDFNDTLTTNGPLRAGNGTGPNGGGTINLINGTIDTQNNNVSIGNGIAGSTGTLVIGDGTSTPTLNAGTGNLQTGVNKNGSTEDTISNITINSGTASFKNITSAQNDDTNTTTININGGTISASNHTVLAKEGGNTTLNQTAGDFSTTVDLTIGNKGDVDYNMDGGTATVGRNLQLSKTTTSNVDMDVTGGTITVAGFANFGQEGVTDYNQTGGTLDITGKLNVGSKVAVAGDGSQTDITIDGTSVVTVGEVEFQGSDNGNTMNLNNGQFTSTGEFDLRNRNGSGTSVLPADGNVINIGVQIDASVGSFRGDHDGLINFDFTGLAPDITEIVTTGDSSTNSNNDGGFDFFDVTNGDADVTDVTANFLNLASLGTTWHSGDIVLFDTSENDGRGGVGEFTNYAQGDIVIDYGFAATGSWNYYIIDYTNEFIGTNSNATGIVLRAVPEPKTTLLIMISILLLFLKRRR